MHSRLVAATLAARARDYPAVALVGPRQCGKTTLARSLGGNYFDLEQQEDRLRLDIEWPRLVSGKQRLVLDEAQAWPEVFARLRGAIDAQPSRKGRFLLLGSVAPSLMKQVSESLAGRLALVEMTPFLLGECPSAAARDRHWLVGGFPDGGLLTPRRFPDWQRDYLSLLVHRDLPTWGLPARPQLTERLLKMLAAWHGQPWNASRLGQSLGINYQTVSSYVDYLEGCYLVRRLAPYHANIGKRLVKAPKVFLRDCGVLHSLLGATNAAALMAAPWVGASWEGYVIEQVLGQLAASGRRHAAWYLRTSDQYEADLVLEMDDGVWVIEVKLTSAPGPRDLARIRHVADMVSARRAIVVSLASATIEEGRFTSTNLDAFLESLAAEG